MLTVMTNGLAIQWFRQQAKNPQSLNVRLTNERVQVGARTAAPTERAFGATTGAIAPAGVRQ
jgi:hypothetical protein